MMDGQQSEDSSDFFFDNCIKSNYRQKRRRKWTNISQLRNVCSQALMNLDETLKIKIFLLFHSGGN